MRAILSLRNLLRAIALGVAIYGVSRAGFWLGALVLFLLWWAENDARSVAAREREQLRIAEHAPELAGMDFAARGGICTEGDRYLSVHRRRGMAATVRDRPRVSPRAMETLWRAHANVGDPQGIARRRS